MAGIVIIGAQWGDEALREQIGDRTVSRLYEICGETKPMFGDDHRLETTYTLPEPVGSWDPDPAYGEPRPRRAPFAS